MKKTYGPRSTNKSSNKPSNLGGVSAAAAIMNLVNSNMANTILADISGEDKNLATNIQDSMFTFDTLVGVDNRAIQVLLRNIAEEQLVRALKGADDTIKDKLFSNMSRRVQDRLLDDIDSLGPLRVADVEEAQRGIMRIARRLSDSGGIVLAINRDDFV